MIKARDELHIRPDLLVHDELVYIIPTGIADDTLAQLLGFMSETPLWWTDGPPMKGDGRVADHFGKGNRRRR
jgi:hypothetical protein